MKKYATKFLIVLLAVMFLPQIAFAQVIVDIPTEFEGSSFGVINRFITADVDANGQRGQIYRLQRGGLYDIDHRLTVDFDLIIIGEEEPADTRPAMISRGVNSQGDYISGLIGLTGYETSLIIKNVIINGAEDDNVVKVSGGNFASIYGPHHRVEYDNCVFSGWGRNLMNSSSADSSDFIFTNNIFRNIVGQDNPWSGNFYSSTSIVAAEDTIKFVNNTFFNTAAYMFLSWEFVNNIEFEHNTIFVSSLNAIWTPYLTNAKFNDNIFYDYQTVGETAYETERGYWDKGTNGNHPSSICKLDIVDPLVMSARGMTEEERNVEYKNNVYAWSSVVKDYWATEKDYSTGTELDIMPITFMNNYTDSLFFNNKNAYPHMVAENNIELDPEFDATLVADVLAEQMPYVKEYRQYGASGWENVHNRYYEPSGLFWDIPWPLAESLVYTNSTVLQHAQGGFPAGDLNWFGPEKIAEWEAWKLTGIRKEENSSLPKDYTLSQNYPNPFNPTTQINFTIPKAGITTLKVYNILGQVVSILVNEQLAAGSYKFDFDGSNLTTGIYMYQLQSSDYSAVKKMLLIK